MNTIKLKQILIKYNEDFETNWNQENYKWRELKQFQDNWNLLESDLVGMMKKSLNESSNLIASKNYFPLNEILHIAQREPKIIRSLFKLLFDEDIEIVNRITKFREDLKRTKKRLGSEKNDGSDLRFISTMLWFRYPTKYSIYKYTEMKNFSENLETGLHFKKGNIKSIELTQFLIEQIDNFIINFKPSVLEKYQNKISSSNEYYQEKNLHMFSQNIIWYAQRTYENLNESGSVKVNFIKGKLKNSSYTPTTLNKGVKTNHIRVAKINKKIGIAGESFVLEAENQKLKKFGFALKAKWVSQNEGDGVGYDILSYNEKKEKIYIEVKTTKGDEEDRFYITSTELSACKKYGERYFLYRLFDFTKTNNIAIYRGKEVENLCNSPYQYAVEGPKKNHNYMNNN